MLKYWFYGCLKCYRTIVNVESGKKEYFRFPIDVFGEPEILNRIKISSLSNKQLVIKYETENGVNTKQYSR